MSEILAVKIKQEIRKGDAAGKTGDSEAAMHYIRAGKYLNQAKEDAGRGNWMSWLKQNKIAEQSANQCMRLADGKTTIEKVRAASRKRKKKSRARTNSRDGHRNSTVDLGQSACDYDWHNPPSADFASPTEMYKKQSEHYNTEATHLATAYPLLQVDPSKITKTEVSAVQDVARAWQHLSQQIARLFKEGHPNAANDKAIEKIA